MIRASRRLAVVAAVASLALAAGGCGGDDDDDRGSTGTTTAPQPLKGALAWERAFAAPEDRRVRIHLNTVPCRLPVRAVSVEEAGDRVTVTVAGQDIPDETACVQVAARRCVLIVLDKPLGERAMVDGSRGERRPVEATGGDDLRCERA